MFILAYAHFMGHAARYAGHLGAHQHYVHYIPRGGGITSMILSAIIHAAVYGIMRPLFHGQGFVGSLVIGIIAIAIASFLYRTIAYRRPRFF